MSEAIPFDILPANQTIQAIKNYSPKTKRQRLFGNCIGKGASREVYPLSSHPNCALKVSIQKGTSNNAQNKTEIKTYEECTVLRPWLPTIHSYDKSEYKWSVVERCDLDSKRFEEAHKAFTNWQSAQIKAILSARAESESEATRKHLQKCWALSAAALKPNYTRDIRKSTERITALCMKDGASCQAVQSMYDVFLRKGLWELEFVVDLLWKGLTTQTPSKKSTDKKKSYDPDCPWFRLSEFASTLNPLSAAVAIEAKTSGIQMRDLHAKNFGFSKESLYSGRHKAVQEFCMVRIIDFGLIRKGGVTHNKQPNKAKVKKPIPTKTKVAREKIAVNRKRLAGFTVDGETVRQGRNRQG